MSLCLSFITYVHKPSNPRSLSNPTKNWKKKIANDQNINPYAQNIIPHAKKKKGLVSCSSVALFGLVYKEIQLIQVSNPPPHLV